MKRGRPSRAGHHPTSGITHAVLESIRGAPAALPSDDHDADLPGCFVERVQLESNEFWRAWRRLRRAAGRRVPAMIMRRRRSKLLIVLAAEDLFALLAAIRAVEDRAQ